MNLLRRLAIEEFVLLGRWVVEPYSVAHPLPGRAPLSWTAQPAGQLQLAPAASADEPSAWVTLVGGGAAAVHVCLGREAPPPMASPETAQVVLWCPTAEGTPIRSENDAREFVRSHMALRWQYLPDTLGLLAAAKPRLRKRRRGCRSSRTTCGARERSMQELGGRHNAAPFWVARRPRTPPTLNTVSLKTGPPSGQKPTNRPPPPLRAGRRGFRQGVPSTTGRSMMVPSGCVTRLRRTSGGCVPSRGRARVGMRASLRRLPCRTVPAGFA